MMRALRACLLGIAILAVMNGAGFTEELDLPTRKAGLWDMKMRITGGGIPTMSMQQCTDAGTDKDLRMLYSPMGKEVCVKREVRKTTTGYSVDRVCKLGEDTLTSRIDISGDFQSGYEAHLTSRTQNDSPDDPPSADMTMTAKYLGPCKSGQEPGDVIMAVGMKMNIRDILKMRERQGSESAN